MKKQILSILTASIIFLAGCANSAQSAEGAEADYNSDIAISGQVGDLSYVVPWNSLKDVTSTEETHIYSVPVENSENKYTLNIGVLTVEDKEKDTETLKRLVATMEQAAADNGTSCETKEISEFLGKALVYGYELTAEGNGQKIKMLAAMTEEKAYTLTYSADSKNYSEATWNAFYGHLKLA